MKFRYPFLLLQLFVFTASAQDIIKPVRLKSGLFAHAKNWRNDLHISEALQRVHYKKRFYTLIQFTRLPGLAERQALAHEGIVLFDYIPDNSFLAEVTDTLLPNRFRKNTISGVFTLEPSDKISAAALQQLQQPMQDPDKLIAVSFFGSIDKATAIAELQQAGAQIVNTKIQPAHVVFINASATAAQKIAALPFVAYINTQHIKAVPLNYTARGANAINTISASAGRNLNGSNVTLGIGDNGEVSTHMDFSGRLINRNPISAAFHGIHTTGTMAGGGIVNPKQKGIAPKATIVNQYFSDILVNTPVYIDDYDMVLTNNSYASAASGCSGEGDYDALSNYVDAQMNAYPALLHVFAAGNDGANNCSPYAAPYATIKSGFQCGKNVLTVGSIDNVNYVNSPSSSGGPVDDGRLKPEIVAGGVATISTGLNNSYGPNWGTSMASPAVTGALGLLYERYRQLNAGANPSAALIKALACNGADDLGNAGPDFIFGFGKLNARNSVEAIENSCYFTNSINNWASASHTILNVPAGAAQIKIMLYWQDPAATPYAATTLVNNLDLTATGSDALVHYPLVLNPASGSAGSIATEGTDSRNNIEQVVINNPPAGNFTVTVSGTSIPSGSQDYVVVYQVIMPSVTVEYPFGEETLVPGETETIRWHTAPTNTELFTIEYSLDNGNDWDTISSTVAATTRLYDWTVPNSPTNTALVRITRNNTAYSDISNYTFSILGQPSITVTNSCPGYASISWSAITSATSYDIMMLRGDSMQTVGTTTSTSYLLSGLNKDSTYWLAVRAVNGTTPGRRSIAQSITPGGGACASPTFDNDLTPDSLVAPVTGRMYTASQLGAAAPQLRIKNLGSIASSGSFNISYQVNGGSIITESSSTSIAAASTYTHTFSSSHDFSAVGTYTIKTWVSYGSDLLNTNDTLVTIIKQLRNDTLILTPSYTEGFETAASQNCNSGTLGFDGLDRCDFRASNSNGRARTFINTGIARTGNRAITLDQKTYTGTPTADSLIATFNLGGYSSLDQLWLSFYYKNHGIDFSLPGNMVWIRGSENGAWIPVVTLSTNTSDVGTYLATTPVNITETLANAVPAQTVSSSFQIKFGENGYRSTNSVIPDGTVDDGYTFDDITIMLAVNDMAVLQVINPIVNNTCALGSAEPITIQVKNYTSSALTNIPVYYSVNGTTVSETIPSVAAGQTINHTFTQTANLSAYQSYTLSVWVQYPGDNYSNNDTLTYTFRTSPLITSYPYLQGFEADNGNWYTGGINSSWQWGTPAATIINKAANGTKAWVTNLTGNHNNSEYSYLYSPCFDLSGLTQPVLSFSHIFRTEDECNCDFHWVEYSTDGTTWNKLGGTGNGTNWYDNAFYQAWKTSVPRWQVSSYNIPTGIPATTVRFRIVMYADPGVAYEGVGIDDIHVFDKAAIYSGANITSGLTQTVSGNNWIHFESGGRRVASIHPNGQNLGNTEVKIYTNTGGIRNNSNQYYLDRNIVIQPATAPTSAVTVRFYFLDSEAKSLISATGCGTCSSISDAYAAGVTQYSNAPLEENGTLSDNSNGTYNFIIPGQVDVMPYDSGYYAEYQVSNFSEFWINSGGPGQIQPLPLTLTSFTVTRNNETAILQWTTVQELNTDHFIIERSTDGITYTAIGTVAAAGNSITPQQYQLTDEHLLNGLNYYRLKMADKDGKFTYSPIRTVNNIKNDFTISMYPNPVTKGVLHIITSVNCNRLELRDVMGRLIKAANAQGTQNRLPVQHISKGMYFITVITDSGEKIEKVFIE